MSRGTECCARAGPVTPASSRTASLVRGAVESVVLARMHPRTKISIVIQVVSDDGSVLAAAINGTCLALLDAGVPCSGTVGAVSVGLLPSGQLLLDPTRAEEEVRSTES